MDATGKVQSAPQGVKVLSGRNMRVRRPRGVHWRALIIGLGIAGCGDGVCPVYPCPEPRALAIVLTAANTGAAIPNGTLTLTGPVITTQPCNGSCDVYGPPGTYTFQASAPGFASVYDTVVVRGSTPACGCGSATTANVTLALVPAAGGALMPPAVRPPSNEALLLPAWAMEAAGALRAPAVIISERRSRSPRR